MENKETSLQSKFNINNPSIYFGGVSFISCFVIAFEVSLSRYFSTASWSTYGYFIISIALFGFSISGTILTLFRSFFEKYAKFFLYFLPLILMPVTIISYLLIGLNEFNILEFQNLLLWGKQIKNIAIYYLILFFPYFLSGLYIGIAFIIFQQQIGIVYAYDLIGASIGAILILFLMFLIHPYYLLLGLIPLLLIASFTGIYRNKIILISLSLVLFILSGILLITINTAHYSKYKPIFAPLNVQNNKVIYQMKSPRGYYEVLDNFTERVDVPLTNNYEYLKITPPPRTFGVYKDGYRVTELKKELRTENLGYINGLLSSLPYNLCKNSNTLILGIGGGYTIREALKLNSKNIIAIDPNPDYLRLLKTFKKNNRDLLESQIVTLINKHPRSFVPKYSESFDIVDISTNLTPQQGGDYIYTVNSIKSYIKALKPGGFVSLPVSIRESYVYALKLLETVKQSLIQMNIQYPEKHILMYRTAWTARILVSNQEFTDKQLKFIKKFCDDRSFDLSYYPRIDIENLNIWNELPEISLKNKKDSSQGMISLEPEDALAKAAYQILGKDGKKFLNNYFFDLRPATDDRPFFFSIIRFSKLIDVIDNLSIIPLDEMDYLVNWVILGEAIILGLLILMLPLLKQKSYQSKTDRFKMIVYFICLGLGYFFVEITLIEKFKLLLDDPTYSFAIVLCGMLVFSGLGSVYSSKIRDNNKKKWMFVISCVIFCSVLFYIMFLDFIIYLLSYTHFIVQFFVILIIIGVPAFFMGMPFPLGMSCLTDKKSYFVPWAWSINGAFSVISSVVTKIIFISFGYTSVFLLSGIVYILAFVTFPISRKE